MNSLKKQIEEKNENQIENENKVEAFNLLDLPVEVIILIIQFLDLKENMNLSQTCKFLLNLTLTSANWFHYFTQKFEITQRALSIKNNNSNNSNNSNTNNNDSDSTKNNKKVSIDKENNSEQNNKFSTPEPNSVRDLYFQSAARIKSWQPNLNPFKSHQRLTGHAQGVWSINLDSDLNTLFSCSCDSIVKVWNLNDYNCVSTFEHAGDWSHATPIYLNKHNLLWARTDGSIAFIKPPSSSMLTNVNSNYEIDEIKNCYEHRAIAAYYNDQFISISTTQRYLANFDTQTMKKLFEHNTSRVVISIDYIPQYSIFVNALEDGKIELHDIRQSNIKPITTIDAHEETIWAMKCSAESIFSCSSDLTARAFDIRTCKQTRIYQGHTSLVGDFAFDESRLATCANDGTIRLWDIKTAKCIQELRDPAAAEHGHWIWSVAFDDNKLIASSRTGNILIFFTRDRIVRKTQSCNLS
eukprot:TRINITY_DN984_c1_g1_i1.p1 TRINITY_DN984_c1_g1~~TRINITY_DN984_c1_g1_i1.p1  ORF type:complete len:468 (+),score=208.57 TRINITY_DN984_c1_g1_i1:85-1488(+)